MLNDLTTTRRDMLKTALTGGVAFLLPALGIRAAERRGTERPKSLITVWLAGGASQLETWDPHPGSAIGGPTTAIPTTMQGVEIASDYPRMAEQIHHLTLIRSMVSKEGDHERGTYLLKTGFRPDPTLLHPSIGSIVTHEVPDPNVEIPLHFSLGGTQWPGRGGYLGARYDAFKIFDPGNGIRNLKSHVGDDRQTRRLKDLDLVTKSFMRGRATQVERTLHQDAIDRALKMMTSEQLSAFELDKESTETRLRYGENNFGRGCLLARRLVESGVRAVEVNLNGFDTHAENFTSHTSRAAELDPALAALVADLAERDLLESTVVLCIGEFGRTPKINPLEGRDHWPNGFSCLVGGGGLASGMLIGATDPTGSKTQPEDPIEVADLFATILKTLGVDYAHENDTPIGRPMRWSDGTPLERLMA